jgi:hypothetical protein
MVIGSCRFDGKFLIDWFGKAGVIITVYDCVVICTMGA